MMLLGFKSRLVQFGFPISQPIIPDGRIHRFDVNGDKRGSKNGWYVFLSDDAPCGAFGSWKTGEKHSWCAKPDKCQTPSQRQERKQRIEKAMQERDAEQNVRYAAAANKAAFIWRNAEPAPQSHFYLLQKQVKSHNLRLHKGALIIPVRGSSGMLHSLQFIDCRGNKRFLCGGRKKGCYFAIGAPVDVLCIAEGYATAASIYEATGHATAVAFDAGNMKAVARALRTKFPKAKIILCADNDAKNKTNTGVTKAREAALAVGGFIAIPPCVGDFNDWARGEVR